MKAVIFDWDGVLIDSESANVVSAVRAFQKLGITINKQDREKIVGRHPDDYREYFLSRYEFSWHLYRKRESVEYNIRIVKAPMIARQVRFAQQLYEAKIPLALTTSSEKKRVLYLLRKRGLEKLFSVIVTKDDCKKRKPDPEPYRITAERLGMLPSGCVVIEDTSLGLQAAKRAGMRCIVIPNAYTKDQNFTRADRVVGKKSKLSLRFIGKFLK